MIIEIPYIKQRYQLISVFEDMLICKQGNKYPFNKFNLFDDQVTIFLQDSEKIKHIAKSSKNSVNIASLPISACKYHVFELFDIEDEEIDENWVKSFVNDQQNIEFTDDDVLRYRVNRINEEERIFLFIAICSGKLISETVEKLNSMGIKTASVSCPLIEIEHGISFYPELTSGRVVVFLRSDNLLYEVSFYQGTVIGINTMDYFNFIDEYEAICGNIDSYSNGNLNGFFVIGEELEDMKRKLQKKYTCINEKIKELTPISDILAVGQMLSTMFDLTTVNFLEESSKISVFSYLEKNKMKLAMMYLASIFMVFYLSTFTISEFQKSKLDDLEEEFLIIKIQYEKLQGKQKQIEHLKKIVDLNESIEADKIYFSDILEVIGRNIPKDIVIVKLSIDNHVIIEGGSKSQKSLSTFVDELEKSSRFSYPVLNFSELNDSFSKELIKMGYNYSFTLRLNFKTSIRGNNEI